MKYQLRRILLSISILAGLGPVGLIANQPEYLYAERPGVLPLLEQIAPLDGIGSLPTLFDSDNALLLPMLENANVVISPRAYFLYRDNDDGTKYETFALGGSAGMVTEWLGDTIRFGLTGYTSQRVHGPRDRDGAGLLQSEQKSYTVLGELYAEVRSGPWLFKVGRQELDMPYLNKHDIRMTPNTFESAILSFSGKHWKAVAAHTWGMKARTSTDFVSMSEQAGTTTKRGVSSFGALYEYGSGSIGAVNHYGWDTFNTFYSEATWVRSISDSLDGKLSLQFTDQRSVGDELLGDFDSRHFGAKFSVGYESLTASLAYTRFSGDENLVNPWGGSPNYNSIIVGDFNRPSEEAIGIGLSYDFSDLGWDGLSTTGTIVFGNTPDSGTDASEDRDEYNFTVDYRIPEGLLKSLWLRARIAHIDGDVRDRWDFRFITNYTLSF